MLAASVALEALSLMLLLSWVGIHSLGPRPPTHRSFRKEVAVNLALSGQIIAIFEPLRMLKCTLNFKPS